MKLTVSKSFTLVDLDIASHQREPYIYLLFHFAILGFKKSSPWKHFQMFLLNALLRERKINLKFYK